MKNVFLAMAMIGGFVSILILSDAPHRNEFVSDLQVTLTKLSQDVPRDLGAKPNFRTVQPKLSPSCELANALVTAEDNLMVEPDCGGWND